MYRVLAPGWVFESIWKYLNTQASIWVFKYYLNTEFCRVFRKVFKYFTHGICPNTAVEIGNLAHPHTQAGRKTKQLLNSKSQQKLSE